MDIYLKYTLPAKCTHFTSSPVTYPVAFWAGSFGFHHFVFERAKEKLPPGLCLCIKCLGGGGSLVNYAEVS